MVKLLTSNINCIVAQYIIQPMKTLKKWIPYDASMLCLSDIEYGYCRNKMNDYELSSSKTIIAKIILNKHQDIISWIKLSVNESKWACKILQNNLDKIDWKVLSSNPSKWACKILENNPDKTDWNSLSLNTSQWAYNLLKLEKINWGHISRNQSKWASNLLKSCPDKIKWWFLSQNESHHNDWLYESIKNGLIIIDKFNISWYWLSKNPTKWAYKILKNNKHRIHSDLLSLNENKYAYNLLKDKINYRRFSLNQSYWVYKLLKNNPDKIYWDYFLAWNPYIFKIVKTNKYYKLFDKKIDIKL